SSGAARPRRGGRAGLLPREGRRPRRAASGPPPAPADPPLAVGAPPVHALSDARRAHAAGPGRHGRRGADGGQAQSRGAGVGGGAAPALALVQPRAPRRALAAPRSRRRAAGRRRARRVLRVSLPRLLVIMGSGETAPTMVTPHRAIVARFATPPRAVFLDTPYGFQENAAEISQRAIDYFAQRVQLKIELAGFPGPLAAAPEARSADATPAALARLRAAELVFSGPGSPTYALATWRGS